MVGVFLRLDPSVLVVAGKDHLLLQGGANESAVVVRRRVDQVADDFLGRPLVGRGMVGGVAVCHSPQMREDILYFEAKLSTRVVHGLLLIPKAARITRMPPIEPERERFDRRHPRNPRRSWI